jgi:hypothetical protein
MIEIVAIVVFMIIAFLVFWGGLHFSQYKKRENAGCCGGGHCSTDGNSSSCYSSKTDFVDNIDNIRAQKSESRG